MSGRVEIAPMAAEVEGPAQAVSVSGDLWLSSVASDTEGEFDVEADVETTLRAGEVAECPDCAICFS